MLGQILIFPMCSDILNFFTIILILYISNDWNCLDIPEKLPNQRLRDWTLKKHFQKMHRIKSIWMLDIACNCMRWWRSMRKIQVLCLQSNVKNAFILSCAKHCFNIFRSTNRICRNVKNRFLNCMMFIIVSLAVHITYTFGRLFAYFQWQTRRTKTMTINDWEWITFWRAHLMIWERISGATTAAHKFHAFHSNAFPVTMLLREWISK